VEERRKEVVTGGEVSAPPALQRAVLPGNDLPRRIPRARRRGPFWLLGAELRCETATHTPRLAARERSRAAQPGSQTRPKLLT
jgi:hypothetical protein